MRETGHERKKSDHGKTSEIRKICHTKNMMVNEPEFAHADEIVLILIPMRESFN